MNDRDLMNATTAAERISVFPVFLAHLLLLLAEESIVFAFGLFTSSLVVYALYYSQSLFLSHYRHRDEVFARKGKFYRALGVLFTVVSWILFWFGMVM